MIAVGVDVHKGRCVFAMMREDGIVKMLEPIECTREAWPQRVAGSADSRFPESLRFFFWGPCVHHR